MAHFKERERERDIIIKLMLNESESGTDESKYCESDKDAFPFWKSAITTRPSVGAVTFHATTVHPMTSAQVTMLHSTT